MDIKDIREYVARSDIPAAVFGRYAIRVDTLSMLCSTYMITGDLSHLVVDAFNYGLARGWRAHINYAARSSGKQPTKAQTGADKHLERA